MNADQYIEDRLDDQIIWYDKKSQLNQKWFKCLRLLEIGFACSIPFLVGYFSSAELTLKFLVGLIGVLIAIIGSILTLYKFQENWIEYRNTCESLRHQKYLFLTGVSPYEGSDAFQVLVENVESLISTENTKWLEYMKSKPKEKNHG